MADEGNGGTTSTKKKDTGKKFHTLARVRAGDNAQTFSERHKVKSLSELVKLQDNEQRLRAAAEARGFSHTHRRTVQDEDGNEKSYVDYHVFPGELLHVPGDSEAIDESYEVKE